MPSKLPLKSGMFLACWIFSSTAGAAEPVPATPAVPRHVVQNMRVSVQNADAAALVTVQATPQDLPGATMKLKVDQTVDGQLPAELEIPIAQFYIGDLEQGVQLLVTLQQKGGQWVGTGHYERIANGTVRDLPLPVYVAKLAETAAQRRGERRAAPAAAAVAALPSPGAPVTAPAVASPGKAAVVPASSVSSKPAAPSVNVATTTPASAPAPAK